MFDVFNHDLLPILVAFLLDWIIGDPPNKFHPIYYLGKLITLVERTFYSSPIPKRLGGMLLVIVVLIISLVVGLEIANILLSLNYLLYYVWIIFVFWICLAFRSLIEAGNLVKYALSKEDLKGARESLSFIVSRDTKNIPEKDIIRGTIESLSENLNDGIIAPLFYAVLFGVAGIIAYKVINTLDSMVGYKNTRYLQFGWFSAKLDDLANFIPARVTFILIFIGSILLGYDYISCWKSVWKYSQTGESPNGGIGICAFAGALGIQLGGTNYFNGKAIITPTVGMSKDKPTFQHIERSQKLIIITTLLGLLFFFLTVWKLPG